MRCVAKSRKNGRRCKRSAIDGGRVCRYHGGAAPQVIQKAAERLAALVDPAITSLARLVRSKNENIRLRAVQDVLDRNGHRPPEKHQLGGLPEAPITFAPDLSKLSDSQLATLADFAAAVYGDTVKGKEPGK